MVTIVVLIGAAPAQAATLAGDVAAPSSLTAVIDNIRNWLVGLLVALATLFLTVGGIRYLLAGGDPGEVAKAKDTLKYAAVGYTVAALAPLLVSILKKFVGA
ncbi:MAG: hypothetical protein GEV07_05395 [Streptosporangiales bacterium]|nr:hypothetical protein [Streptosporangiales bacterium]